MSDSHEIHEAHYSLQMTTGPRHTIWMFFYLGFKQILNKQTNHIIQDILT